MSNSIYRVSAKKKKARDIEERITWLQHLLGDPDSGRFYSNEDLSKIKWQLKKLQKIAK